MGFIEDMQEEPDGPFPAIDETVKRITRQWKEGTTAEISYHSQMALLMSIIKNAAETRLHAAKVPDTAPATDRTNALMGVARILVYEKKIGEAIECYRQIIDINPENDMAVEELGWCLYEEQSYADAEAIFQQGIALDPDCDWLYEAGGFAASQQEKYEVALDYFNKALAKDENHTNTDRYEYAIGLCYEKMGDFYRALAHYIKCLDINPSYADALNNMAALYFEHESDIQTAMSYLRKAETIAEEQDNKQLLQTIYINMIRLNSLIVDYEAKEHYNIKLLELLGFAFEPDDDDSDNE